MASASPILITDALVALAKEQFTQAVDCYRSHDGTAELKDLQKGRIDFIAPTAWSKTFASRSHSEQTCDITAYVRKQFERYEQGHAKQGDIDAWLTFVDEFSDAAWAESLAETVSANVTEIDIPTPFDRDALKNDGMFASIVTFRVRYFKRFN